jgi:hypothetical protein
MEMMASPNERAGPSCQEPASPKPQQFPLANSIKEIASNLSTTATSLIGPQLLLSAVSTGCYSSECCEVCSASNNDTELFGYRQPDGWRWFCAAHRLGKWYADKRLPALTNNNNGGSNDQTD